MLEPKNPRRGRDNFDMMLRKFFIKKYGLPKTGHKVSVCPDIVALSNYVNQSLNTSEMEHIKTHLARCRRCRLAVDSTLDAVRRFELGDLEKIPDNVSFNIEACLKKLRNKNSGNTPKK